MEKGPVCIVRDSQRPPAARRAGQLHLRILPSVATEGAATICRSVDGVAIHIPKYVQHRHCQFIKG